jgi:NitT/TauT family transport system substrate-binding protein
MIGLARQLAQSEVLVSTLRSRLVPLGLVAALLGACGGGASTPSAPADPSGATTSAPAVASPTAAASPAGALDKLTVGLGYIPSVQFAPFYLAQQEGWYAEAGLEVEFQNKIDPDLITLVGQGAIDVGLGDGTSVIPAVSQGIPVRYLATFYGRFPGVVFAKASSGITTAADLAGRKIGTPGRYGSGWVMLQALLGSAGLSPEDVEVVEYPDFTQRIAVEQDAVDAATGFANNEPVQLELGGETAVILRIDDITPLPGPGLIAGVDTLERRSEAVAAFVTTTLRAMEAIAADPELGLEAAIAAVPELATAREAQLAVLEATIETWTGSHQASNGLGAVDRDGWAQSIEYLESIGLVPNPVTVDDVVRDDLFRTGY